MYSIAKITLTFIRSLQNTKNMNEVLKNENIEPMLSYDEKIQAEHAALVKEGIE